MEQYICNKCYCTQEKIKYPFEVSQCGHIFCHNCLKQVRNKCPQCGLEEIKSVPLTEPLMPEVSRLFTPLDNILLTIKSLMIFQSEQISITLQHFYQINDKYEMLKQRYLNALRNERQITCEYYNLKKNMESLEKKLMFMKTQSINSKIVDFTPCSMRRQGIMIKHISD